MQNWEWITKSLLSRAEVATRGIPDKMADAILRTLLLTTEDAILVTDLDHRSLAVNRLFGEYFLVKPEVAVAMEPEELREKVYPRLRDPQRWRDQLDEIYAEPQLTYSDEMELIADHPLLLKRTTGPVIDTNDQIVGRLWTFKDVTEDRRRDKMRETLYDVSTFHDSDPAVVCRHIVQTLSSFYEATAILSIRQGKVMAFKEIAGVPADLAHVKENQLKDSYCQVALKNVRPLIVQDAKLDPFFSTLLPAKFGFTRYLGAPIIDGKGRPIGTLCFMDGRSDCPLSKDDEQFLSMLTMRIATELERERIYLERTAQQRDILEKQRSDLAETHRVLQSMNEAFGLLNEQLSTQRLLDSQAEILKGVLGYDSVALVIVDEAEELVKGPIVSGRSKKAKQLIVPFSEMPAIRAFVEACRFGKQAEVSFQQNPSGAIAKQLGAKFTAVSPLRVDDNTIAVLVLGRSNPPNLHDERHSTHLEAIADQVCLMLTSHFLDQKLVTANEELRSAHQRLIQSEKLSIVGTLSASVAHDIRNILSSLQLECSMTEDPEIALASVRLQLDRFAILAHRLLSYARPKLLARTATDINEVLEHVLGILDAQIRITNVEIVRELDLSVPCVMSDSNQIEHIFVNLVMNALQAMHARGGTLTVRTKRLDKSIRIEIVDTGGGIPADKLDSLFQPFKTTRSNGFGLGLFSCKRIADEHGWSLVVDSIPGQGTTFSVTAPIEDCRK